LTSLRGEEALRARATAGFISVLVRRLSYMLVDTTALRRYFVVLLLIRFVSIFVSIKHFCFSMVVAQEYFDAIRACGANAVLAERHALRGLISIVNRNKNYLCSLFNHTKNVGSFGTNLRERTGYCALSHFVIHTSRIAFGWMVRWCCVVLFLLFVLFIWSVPNVEQWTTISVHDKNQVFENDFLLSLYT
jgi:hypothetical protein